MAVVAYLRVSTEKQFLENQREEIIRFAERNGMSIDRWYTETVSGSVSSKERKLVTGSGNVAIDWNSFNIAADEIVNFKNMQAVLNYTVPLSLPPVISPKSESLERL